MAVSHLLGVIPAAGLSTRIGGGPKPLLDTGDGTFLERVIGALRGGGVERIVVGVREEAGPVAAAARRSGAEVVIPDGVEAGPIATVRTALRMARKGPTPPKALLLLPADFPLVQAETVAALIQEWKEQGAVLVRPRQGARTGHPALFAGPALDALLEPDLPEGPRTVVDRFREEGLEVEVPDRGIHVDIDTLPDYRRSFPDAYRKRFQKW